MLTACKPPQAPSSTRGAHLNRTQVLNHISAKSAGVTFVSRNGRFYGMDSDACITLSESNQTTVTEFGYARQTYDGTYSVDDSGAILVSLRRYPAKWPSMYLYTDSDGAILLPTNQERSFNIGGRAGAVEKSDMAPYWPFRQTK
jgi:hypothetical protein